MNFLMIIFSDIQRNDSFFYISRIKMSYTNDISILLPFRGHLNLKCMHVDITIIIFMKMEKESQGWYYERTICFCVVLWVNDSELIRREILSACGGLDESQGCRICYKFGMNAKKKKARLMLWFMGISLWFTNYSSPSRR